MRGALDSLPVVVSLVCIGLFAFLSGGYIYTRSAPIALAYLLLAAVWVWFLVRRSWPPPVFLAALVALAALAGWTGLSTLWSFGPDLSWMAFNVAAFYAAVMAVSGCTPVRRLQLRLAGWGFLAVVAAVAVYAFLGKGLPDVVRHANTYARLDSPIGYWNVLALVMVMGMFVAVSLAADRALHPVARAVAAAAATPMAFAFFFTFSRGGYVALGVAALVYFALTTSRLSSLASLAVVVAPVGAVLWRLRGLDTLFSATTDAALRAAEGHSLLRWATAALVATAVAQLAVAYVHGAVTWPRWSRLAAGAAVLALLVAGSAAASWRYLEPRGGLDYVGERVRVAMNDADTRAPTNQAGRLVSLNTGRPPLWREAVEQSRVVRLAGTGAGTFAFTHFRFREHGGVVRHAHSQWFNALSELGIVGLVLVVAAVVLAVAACFGNPFAGRRDLLRPLVVALQAGVCAFAVHLTWDWTWDMAVAGAAAFLFVGVSSSYLATRRIDDRAGEPAAPVTIPAEGGPEPVATSAVRANGIRPWPLRLAASVALLLLAASWTLPYLAARSHSQAVSASGQGRPADALSLARRAARLDPLAARPLITEALALQQLGRDREALEVVRDARALQPDNFEVHYQEGLLLLKAFGRRKEALAAFRRTLQLNPQDGDARREIEALLGG